MPNAVEKIIAKGKGKAKAINARLEGLTGVFSHLAEEHGEVSAMLSQLRSSDDPEKREDLWNEIRIELVSHERAEVAEVYPVFRRHPDLAEIAEEHDEEAGQLEAAVNEVDETDVTSDDWEERLERLITLVKQHAEEEEQVYFPSAQNVLERDTIAALQDVFHAAKEAAKRELE
jgi:hemerythrin-like domain-containing protein